MTDYQTEPLDTVQEPTKGHERKKRRWLVPAVVGVLAFLLGVGVGGSDDVYLEQIEQLESELAAAHAQVEQAESQAAELADDLEAAEQRLADAVAQADEREAALEEREAKLDDREAEIAAKQSDLDAREAALDEREADLDEREAALDEQEVSSSSGGTESSGGSTSVYYQNCDAARAAGAAPVRRGDPGYGPHLDRDGDGVGCE